MSSSLFHVQLWPYTIRNGFRAERTESSGTIHVAKIKWKMESYCHIRESTEELCFSTTPAIVALPSSAVAWTLLPIPHKKTSIAALLFLSWSVLSCNASYAAPQTTCPEKDPAFLMRWPNLLAITVKRDAPSSRRKVTVFKQGYSSGKLFEGIFPHRVIVRGSW